MTSLFRKDDRRILAIWFPWFATERVWRQHLGRCWRSRREPRPPLALSHRDENTQRVFALDEKADALGLRRGLGIADVRARHPGVAVVEADPQADRRLLEALADWCDRYTPLVAIHEADCLMLDVTGCAHLFGGEDALLADFVRRLAEQGFEGRAGLASTPGMAWAAAHYSLPPVPPGEEAEALASLPLDALRIEPATRNSMESVGLRHVGSIIAAPRAPLTRRFGKALILRLDQALGHVEEAITPRLPVPALSVERHFADPVSDMGEVERLIPLLAGRLKSDLERRGEGARRLHLALFRADGAVSRIAVGTSRPLRDPLRIARLFREKLTALQDDLDAGYGFDLMRLAVLAAAQMKERQGDLAAAGEDQGENLAMLADRIEARLGAGALVKPSLLASHMPQEAWRPLRFAGPPPKPAPPPERLAENFAPVERPIRFFGQPEPVEVTAEIPEGPPARFRWRNVAYRVARAEGPERIEPEWWHSKETGPARDYYRVEDEEGRRYWLCREGKYDGEGPMPRWYVQGLFA
jgi:protein ImuB